ncbi:hypothetical protein PG994_004925 [Apiospora phragmitis]|uniref:Uncharacterized protein n=1 Tax=Apiospora phragmitis TaxID=2905665 RepID=A0ABR1VRY6_9PEZI
MELAMLKHDPSHHLWPKPLWLLGDWLAQTADEVLEILKDVFGYLRGCAPLSVEELANPHEGDIKPNQYPFKIPVNVELNDEFRGDSIMRGLYLPAYNLQGKRQHCKAYTYLFDLEVGDMGAVIKILD